MTDRPLFIPLKREWFEAFARGEKTDEWRRHGARWNLWTCRVDRPVILSLGYSTPRRLHARIVMVTLCYPDDPVQIAFFGEGVECIVLGLADIRPV